MSLSDDILKLRKKRLLEEEEEKKKEKEKEESSFSSPLTDDILRLRKQRLSGTSNDDIAPYPFANEYLTNSLSNDVLNTYMMRQAAESEVEEDDGYFKKSKAFDDGWQFGDVIKTVGGTVGDAGLGVVQGGLRLLEGVSDLILHGASGVSRLVGADETADSLRAKALNDSTGEITGGIDDFLEDYSVLGEKADAVAEGLGQVGAIILTGGIAGAAGASAGVASAVTTGVMGLSSMGSGMSEAYQSGATDNEAVAYGAMKGVVDAGSELIFGGLGKTVKALGLSRGMSSLDDMFAKKLSGKISNRFYSNLVEFGVKATAEGTEEVLAGIGSAIAKDLTYMSEEDLGKLIKDENLLDQFITGTITSGISQSGIVPGMKHGSLIETTKQGRDFVTGLNKNETSVVDKVYEDRVKEAEKDGKKLTAKEKNNLYEEVISDMDKGYISIDTIEEVLGGDTYKSYKDTIDSEEALKKELEELNSMKTGDLTGVQSDRLAELKAMDFSDTSKRDGLKARLRNEIYQMTKGSRLGESYIENYNQHQRFTADLNKYNGNAKEFVKQVIESGTLNNSRVAQEKVDFIAKAINKLGIEATLTSDAELQANGQLSDLTKDIKVDGSTNKIETGLRYLNPKFNFAVKVGDTVIDSKNYEVDYETGTITFKDAPQGDITVEYQRAPNGMYDAGKMTLNSDNRAYLSVIAGHEITHDLAKKAKSFAKLQKALFAHAKATGEYDSRRKALERLYVEKYAKDDKFNAKIDEELTADLVGEYIFTDTAFLENLYKQDQNVFKQVWDSIKHLVKMATAGSTEARELEKAQMRFEQVWREGVKATNNGVKAQNSDTKYSLSDIAEMSERDYNHHGWAKVNDLLDDQEFADFMKKTGDKARSGKNWYRRLDNGHHMFEVGHDGVNNTVVISDGKFINPSIDRVYHIGLNNETDIEVLRELIYDYENTSEWSLQGDDIKEIFRDEPVGIYTAQDFQSYRELRQGQERAEGEGNSGLDSGLQDGRRSATQSEEHPLKTSSTDGVFFDGKRYSLSDPETDRSYLDAVNRNDMDTAQKIVESVAKEQGYTVHAYHGTARGDRVGNVFLPERATSGPMAFFTSDKTIAENYSKSKQDTSMAYDPDYDSYETQFRIKTKYNDMPLYKAWGYLPFDARNRITKKASQCREDWDGDGELMLDPDTNEANGGFQWQLKESRGNAIKALIEQWLNSGNLFNEESRFLDVLEMTGVTEEFKKIGMDSLYFKDPNAKHEKVYDTFLKINNPFDTANVDEQFISNLEAWYEDQDQDQYVRVNMQSDMWDKNGIDAYDFAERLRSDIENNTTHAWTSIPDSVTDYLKSLGYDGIKDTGGKYGGDSHVVWIPFSSEQVKSAEPVTYDDSGKVISLSERFNTDKSDIRFSLSEVSDSALNEGEAIRYHEDIAPVMEAPVSKTETTVANNAPVVDNSTATNTNVDESGKRITRKQLHEDIINNIKSVFKQRGLDFDQVLKKAKNLSTWATVDNTPSRVMKKSLGYKEGGILADLTVNKVAQNETEGIKWLNTVTDRKNGLLAQLSKQYNIKPGSKEVKAAQMYAEGFYVAENDEIYKYGDAELAKDFRDVQVQNNIKGLVNDPRIRQFYDDTLAMINESRTRNGYAEIPRLDNYYLHYRAMGDTFSKLGLPFNPNDIKAKDLPTDLNGVTIDNKPGQPYFASSMHRTGKRTTFDLFDGIERYAVSAKNQIFHIDDIQTLRALRNYLADSFGQANGLEGLDEMSDAEAQERIKEVFNSHMSTFAKFLNEEANILAGKTALADRAVEGVLGRRAMTFLDTVNRQVGSNAVGYSASSAIVNLDAIPRAFAKTNKADFVKAFAQMVSNSVSRQSDGFAENSPVIIRRKGADRFNRTLWQKMSDPGYALMGAVDNIATELIARTKYNEYIRKGMDSQQAHFETDKWVSDLMGDRSLGQMPQIFNSKMLGLFTKFQLEVRNNLDSMFYDTIQEKKASTEEIQNELERNAKTAAKATWTIFQLAVAQHVFGKAFEAVAGYNPSFDIIDAIMKAFGWDDEEDEDTALDNIEQGFLALLEDMPYASTFTGGRIPISNALPFKELITGEDEYGKKSRWETLGEIAPYYLLPGGYGQIKKTIQGLDMFSDEHPIAGSYTDSGNLRFPVDDTLANRVQAGLFGQWSSKNAQQYIDEGRSPLSEKQIQELIDVGMSIQDYWKYRDGLKGLTKLAEKADYIDSLDLTTDQKNVLINNIADREEDIDMSDYSDYGDFEEFDFAIKNPEKYAVSKAISDDFTVYKQYTKALSDIKSDKDKNGETISGSRKKKVIDYINNLDAEYGEKIILYKSEYPSDNTYNMDIIEYLNSRDDISYEEMVTILQELDMKVSSDGSVTWD